MVFMALTINLEKLHSRSRQFFQQMNSWVRYKLDWTMGENKWSGHGFFSPFRFDVPLPRERMRYIGPKEKRYRCRVGPKQMFFKISKHKHVQVINVHAHISSLQIWTVNDKLLRDRRRGRVEIKTWIFWTN